MSLQPCPRTWRRPESPDPMILPAHRVDQASRPRGLTMGPAVGGRMRTGPGSPYAAPVAAGASPAPAGRGPSAVPDDAGKPAAPHSPASRPRRSGARRRRDAAGQPPSGGPPRGRPYSRRPPSTGGNPVVNDVTSLLWTARNRLLTETNCGDLIPAIRMTLHGWCVPGRVEASPRRGRERTVARAGSKEGASCAAATATVRPVATGAGRDECDEG